MDNCEYGTMILGATFASRTYSNSVVDETLQQEMMDAESEDKVLELSVERLYQNLKESIKL